MKNKHIVPSLLFVFLLITIATCPAVAQPWVKKASKSIFTLKTFDAQGALVGSAPGVFVGTGGEALSLFAPFRGASRAVVIDASGKEWPVEVLLGANDTYDVARFRVAMKKCPAVVVAPERAREGSAVWLLPLRESKQAQEGRIRRAEIFNGDYGYYTLQLPVASVGGGLPLFDDEGRLLALMQTPMSADTVSYAVSARFADSLQMSGLSINDPALRATDIRKALPRDFSQAQLTLFVAASSLDSAAYAQLVDDFIAQFPEEPEGYVTRAQFAAGSDRYADADADMERALQTGRKTDETHYSYSRLVYQKLIYQPEPPYEPWTFDRALHEAEAAYGEKPLPAYRQQQAYILFAQQEYRRAATLYDSLFSSPLRSSELFYEASRCHLALADTTAYLALLDSAVSLFSRPYLKEAAPYILARAQGRMDAGRYRDATADFNDYEQLMAQQVNDHFYYLRFQAEQGGRLFQQALNDITKAIDLNPRQELYYAEKASLEVRVGLYDEAIATAEACIALAPDYSDGHLFLGLARCLKGQKAEGIKSLQRARELGDTQADGLIEKYGK